MISLTDIEKLAELSRIKMSDAEKESLRTEFDSILGYVDQIKKASPISGDAPEAGEHRNIMREDANAHESGIHTEKLLNSAPHREGQYVKVKKILQ